PEPSKRRRNVTSAPWLIAERRCGLPFRRSAATRQHQPVDEEDNERSNDGGKEARAFAVMIPADRTAEEAGEKSSGDTEQDGEDAAAGVTAWHEQLRDRAGKTADHNPSKYAVG